MKKRELTRNTVKLVIVSICMAIALLISAFYTVIAIKTIVNDVMVSGFKGIFSAYSLLA